MAASSGLTRGMLDRRTRAARFLALSHLLQPTRGETHMPDDLYVLPDLAYDPGALEPHISGRIMELHHGKHHAAYVKGANAALVRLDELRRSGEFATIAQWEKNLAFNVSGHVLHSIFWTNLTPQSEEPNGELANALDDTFGGVPP